MKKQLLILLLGIAPFAGQAQFKKLLNKVKDKVDQRVSQKTDKAIDEALDKAEGKTPDKAEGKSGSPAESTPATEKASSNTPDSSAVVKSFTKYDFVAGEQIVYDENFDQEAIGELPTGWNTNGSGEVVTLEPVAGKWLQLHKDFNYLTSNTKLLGENYTIEFDLILRLKNNGWMYPTFTCGIFSSNNEPASGNAFLKDFNKYASVQATIYPGEYNSTKLRLESYASNAGYFSSEPKSFEALEKCYGKPVHVAIQVQKERFRLWVNETKAFDVPKGVPLPYKMNQFLFRVGSTNYSEADYAVYISNIKAAQGIPDTRHKLIEEGRFSTTAILFEVNAASLKPQSYGVIKEIAGVLTQNKDVAIRIIGHTDSNGQDAANLSLSQKRAAAVKNALVTDYAIDASRISTDGKGESQPVADNKTREGRAANRRVEFIKQ